MKIALTIPSAGAGKWCWTGWANAFIELGHEIVNFGQIVNANRSYPYNEIDLLICSTSCPNQDFIDFKPKKVALNVLAWTDENLPCINNPGVQASPGNVEYAKTLKPDVVFAQYSKPWNKLLLKNWIKEGFKDSSMMMAADSVAYISYLVQQGKLVSGSMLIPQDQRRIFYTGGYWPYKAQNINKYLLPIFRKYAKETTVIGKGWPFLTQNIDNEGTISKYFNAADVCPNIHEPHSTEGGYDIVERCFKVPYCGGLLVSDYVQEMADIGFKNGINCFLCKTPKEYAEIIDEIIKNPEKYDHVRKAGQEFVASSHTYIHRAKALLADLGL